MKVLIRFVMFFFKLGKQTQNVIVLIAYYKEKSFSIWKKRNNE